MKDQVDVGDQRGYKWIILTVTLLAFIAFAYGFQIAPPLIPSILKEFKISNAEAGLLMAVVLIPGIFLSVPIILIMDRYGAKRIVLISLLFVVLGSMISGIADTYFAKLCNG